MITQVRLKNWKSHRETDLRFGDGTNVLVGQMGAGKSLPYNELVVAKYDKWGKYPIGEIVENALRNASDVRTQGDTSFTTENPRDVFVQCLNPSTLKIEPRKVRAFIKHKNSSLLIRLRTRTGRRIVVTKEHSLLMVEKSGKIVPRKGSEIKVGDYLPCAKTLRMQENDATSIDALGIFPEFRCTTEILQGLKLMANGFSREKAGALTGVAPHVLDNWKQRKMTHEPELIIGRDTRSAVPRNFKLSSEFAVLAGAYLSEGHSNYNVEKSNYSFRITNKEREFLDEIKRCWKMVFPNIRYQLIEDDFRVNSKVIAAFFARLYGADSATKKIPNFMYGANEELLASFLGAYFEGDGWIVPKRAEVACASKSLSTIDTLLTILSKWGIIGTIRERKVNGVSYYGLAILPKHVPILFEHLRLITGEKRAKLLRAVRVVKNRRRWDGVDIIPNVKGLLRSLGREYHLSSRKNSKAYSLSRGLASYIRNQNIGREKLKRCLQSIFEIYGFKSESFCKLEKIAHSDIFFDDVVKIEEVESESEWVYDLSVEGTENFVAGHGNFVVHNSAVLDAITYAFFGTLPAIQTRRIKLENLITSRPSPMDRAEVEVGFTTPEGDEYLVKRVIEREKGTTLSELRKGTGELIESPSSTRVSEAIGSLLKLDYDLFERAIYSEQNRLDYFLTLPRGKRMESIDELLGINKLELARKNIGSLANRIGDRVKEREKTVAQLRGDVSLTLLPTYEQELKDMESSRREMEIELQRLQPKLDAVSAQLQQLRKTQQELVGLESALRELEGAISAQKRQLDLVRGRLGAAVEVTPEELRQRVSNLERAFTEAQAKENGLNSSLTADTSRVRELETRVTMMHENLEKLRIEVERKRELSQELKELDSQELARAVGELQLESRRFSDELAASRARVEDLQQTMGELSAAGSTCPVCETPLEEGKKQRLLEEREGQLEAQLKRVSELDARVKELNGNLSQKLELHGKAQLLAKEVEDLPAREAEHSQLFGMLRDSEGELRGAREAVRRLGVEVDGVRKEVESLREQLTSAKQTLQLRIDLGQLELEHKQKRAESLRAQQELWRVRRTYDERLAKEVESRHEELIRTHEHLRTELIGREQVIAEKRKLVESIEEKRDMLSRCGVEIEYLRGAAGALNTIQTALARTQTALRREFIDGVNEAMSDLWENVYPYGDFTGVRLAVEGGERGGDYVLQLRDRAGNWVPVEGMASGGERTDACLALRIAFAIVLAPSLSWIVLDEPTHNLDEDGIQELARVMRERLPEVVRQILIITHEQRLEEAVSGYLYRFSRNKDADEPTRVERITVPESFG